MNSDEARIRLEAVEDRRWRGKFDARVRKLPKKSRSIVNDLFADDAQNTHAKRIQAARKQYAAGVALDAASAKDRLRIMRALHPQMGYDLASWWTAAVAHPYSRTWWRRAFRAPNNPEVSVRARTSDLATYVARLGMYDRDIAWLAEWAGHSYFLRGTGPLLASAIEHNAELGDQVFDILAATVRGEHSVGVIDSHAIVGLLRSPRSDGWDLIEGLLLAAQRQEGLRQTILESADEASLPAFVRILDLIEREDLTRFAATTRAISTWTGDALDVEQNKTAKQFVGQLRDHLSAETAAHWHQDMTPVETYMVLLAHGIADAAEAVDAASAVIAEGNEEQSAAAAEILRSLGPMVAFAELRSLLDHTDLRSAWQAFVSLSELQTPPDGIADDFLRLAERVPKKVQLEANVFGRAGAEITKSSVIVGAIRSLGTAPLDIIVPFVSDLDADGRWTFATTAHRQEQLTPAIRGSLLDIIAGRGTLARDEALKALTKTSIGPDEAERLEALLTRKSTGLRQGVVQLLSTLPSRTRLESATRLWEADTPEQREAACDLIAEMEDDQATTTKSLWAKDATTREVELLGIEATPVNPLASLIDEADRTPAIHAPKASLSDHTLDKESAAIPGLLDDLFEANKNRSVEVSSWQGTDTILLGDVRWLREPFYSDPNVSHQQLQFLLGDEVRSWWTDYCSGMPEDPAELAGRCALSVQALSENTRRFIPSDWEKIIGQPIGVLRHPTLVRHALGWLSWNQTTNNLLSHCIAALEWQVGQIKPKNLRDRLHVLEPGVRTHFSQKADVRQPILTSPWLAAASILGRSEQVPRELAQRLWNVLRWIDEPVPGVRRKFNDGDLLLKLYEREIATASDVAYHLMTARQHGLGDSGTIERGTKRRRGDFEKSYPKSTALMDQIRHVTVGAELARGELPTPTSTIVRHISSVEGVDLAMQALSRLGSLSLSRGYVWGDDKKGTLSHIIRVCYPAQDDSAETLQTAAKTHGVKERRLVEFGVYAPQWAAIVEETLGWPGYQEAVWWIHAHTKDRGWSIGAELRETWEALSAERTELSGEDLLDGGVDRNWFWRIYDELGEDRWNAVVKAGKYAASGSGHRRAVIFAEALLGSTPQEDLTARIKDKRHQDTVRSLGLLPLPKTKKAAQRAMLDRYATIKEFERTSSKFGSQRQASERAAARIGIENLARNAGYRDPLQFSWAMESEALADLADGPIVATKDDLTVTLSIDAEGVAQLAVDRAGKSLKAVPAKLRKDPTIAPLRDRKTALVKQVSRVRRSLEASLVAGDRFEPKEVVALMRHPIVAPMLSSIVLADDEGSCVRIVDKAFVDVNEKPAVPSGSLRLAHPSDLLASGVWSQWHEWCFVNEVRQPFKQIFRELYVPTTTETSEGPLSDRYKGHQVQPGQAQGLFKSRGWTVDFESHVASRAFHQAGFIARVDFQDGFLTPAEVELPTVNDVWFSLRGQMLAQPIDTVPDRVFSEAMRDLDLVVSVAHAGGVDPEASASTVEMRMALARETVRLLKLDNVEFTEMHAVIEGKLGEYSLHLGSGVVHRRPGGHVFVLPVHSQRRGRLFLPFADDDPHTAEIMSKLVLFGRDDKIQDPTILRQLRAS